MFNDKTYSKVVLCSICSCHVCYIKALKHYYYLKLYYAHLGILATTI